MTKIYQWLNFKIKSKKHYPILTNLKLNRWLIHLKISKMIENLQLIMEIVCIMRIIRLIQINLNRLEFRKWMLLIYLQNKMLKNNTSENKIMINSKKIIIVINKTIKTLLSWIKCTLIRKNSIVENFKIYFKWKKKWKKRMIFNKWKLEKSY
jgi:hypothetical protein